MTDYKALVDELDSGCNDGADLPDVLNRAARAVEALVAENERLSAQVEADRVKGAPGLC